MDKYNIAVLSCVRDVEPHIEESLYYITEFKKLFKSVKFFAAENDSIDNTYELAKKYSSTVEGEIFKFDNLNSKYKHRTHRLAFLRNFLLERARSYDYIIVADLDSILHNFNIEGLKTCFEYDINSWDAFGANCNNKYYDVWALRNNELNYDCWDRVHHEVQNGRIQAFSVKDHIAKYQRKIELTSKLIPVYSCCGGMMIYKTSSIANCKYNGIPKKCESPFNNKFGICNSEVSEHVNLNLEAVFKNKAKIFINPRLIVNCQIEHLH
jgi:hypothetical protein